MRISSRHNHGFTLIEMAIVLVIIGLIVGSVLVGQNLIKAAQLRSFLKDVESYRTAVYAFRTKYDCLPGDCANATQFFGTNPNCPGTGTGSPGTGTQTCNGNGDGQVGTLAGSTCIIGSERYLFWQHLANAGLIAGQYTGITGYFPDGACNYPTYVSPGINAPVPNIGSSGAGIETFWAGGGDSCFFPGSFGHVFMLGGTLVNHGATDPLLSTGDALYLDQKVDDGLPGTGWVQSWTDSCQAPCATTSNASTAKYDLTLTGPGHCNLVFSNVY